MLKIANQYLFSNVCFFFRSDLEKFVECITGFSHHLGDCVIHGIATSQSTAQIESGEALSNSCRTSGESGLNVLNALEKGIKLKIGNVI